MLKTKKETKLLLFFLLFLVVGLSCSKEERADNSFIIATYDDVKDWDPATAFSLEVLPMSNIYEPLLWYDAGVDPPRFLPGLATSYEVSSDGLIWEFSLREGVSFHDGTPFDSKAVKFVVDRNKSLYGGASYIWSSVDEVLMKGSNKVIFKLNSPAPLDKIVSSQYGAWMYSPKISLISKDSMQNGYASGTGPYKYKSWDKNRAIVLEKFDNYWRGWHRSDHYESIIIKVVSESSTRLQMIESGMADYALLIPIQLLNRLKDNDLVSVSYRQSWINHFYLLNTKKYPTNNVWVRRAIASAMDIKTVSDYVYRHSGTEAAGIIPKNIPLFMAPDSLISFNLENAKKYLQRSKIKPEDISINLSYVSTSEEYRLTSYMLMDNLKKIGINLTLNPGLWSKNWDKARRLESAPNIISMAWWPTLSSPSDWFFGLYRTEENPIFNLSYYSNEMVDSLMDVALKKESTEPAYSSGMYKQIQEELIDDCVVIPVVDLRVQSVHKKNIKGLRSNPAYSTLLVYHLGKK